MPTITSAVPKLPLTVSDAVCFEDCDCFGAETTSDLQTLIQDVFHILLEEPGSNPDDVERGVGVESALSGTVDDAQKLPARIEEQLGEDDRIDAVTAALTLQPDDSYILNVTIMVDGAVIPLAYSYDAGSGLAPLS